jgi:hypothetical protein
MKACMALSKWKLSTPFRLRWPPLSGELAGGVPMLEQHAQILHEHECHDEEHNVPHGVPRKHNPTQGRAGGASMAGSLDGSAYKCLYVLLAKMGFIIP